MNQNRNASNGGIGLSTALFLIFITLKLTGHIDWSWWWVTSPLWIGWGGILLIVGIIVLVALVRDR